MITNNPIIKDEKTYNKLAVNLSISTVVLTEAKKILVNANLRLTPLNSDCETLSGDDKIILLADVENSTDPDILECVATIDAAIQKVINAKNL